MTAEWPLVVFTVASELACGLAFAAWTMDLRVGSAPADGGRVPGLLVFPVALLGLAGSLFHLGHPLSGWRAIVNWRSSPLSAEVLSYGLFLAAAAATSALWLLRERKGRPFVGAIAAAAGLAAVVSSALIYLLPARAPWDSAWVPVSFLASALVLGATGGLAYGVPDTDVALRKAFRAAAGAGGLAVVAAAVLLLVRVSGRSPDAYASAQLASAKALLTSGRAGWLVASVLFAGLLPVAAACLRWRSRTASRPEAHVVFWAVLAGVVAGRLLMFAVGTLIPVF